MTIPAFDDFITIKIRLISYYYDDYKMYMVPYKVFVKVIGMIVSGYANAAPLTNGSAGSPLGRAAGSPPVTGANGAGPSPMAALMSVADTLPPGSPRSAGGSPPQPPQQRSASRSSQHSPNSSGIHHPIAG